MDNYELSFQKVNAKLYFRLYKPRPDRKYFSLGFSMPLSSYDNKSDNFKEVEIQIKVLKIREYLKNSGDDLETTISMVKEFLNGESEKITVEDAFNHVVKKAEGQLAFSTVEAYNHTLKIYRSIYPELFLLKGDRLTKEVGNKIKSVILSKYSNVNTINNHLTVMGRLFKMCCEEWEWFKHPLKNVSWKRTAYVPPKILTKEEFRELYNFQGYHSKEKMAIDMLIFSYELIGLNLIDILKLRYSNIYGDSIYIKRQKTNQSLALHLTPLAAEILEKYKGEHSEYVFYWRQDRFTLGTKDWDRNYKCNIRNNFDRRLKLASQKAIGKKISFYWARYTWVENALNQNMSLRQLSEMMEHSKISTTQHYIRRYNSKEKRSLSLGNSLFNI